VKRCREGTKRPVLLIALVVVSGLIGAFATALGLYMTIQGLLVGGGPMGQIGALFGEMVLVPGVTELVLALGLWQIQLWAWWLGVVWHLVVAAPVVSGLYSTMYSWRELLIAALLIVFVICLFTPQIRSMFMHGRRSRVPSVPTQ
jgi:hypothetical protein